MPANSNIGDFFQYILGALSGQLRTRLGAQQSVLSRMTPQQQSLLTPEAKRILSRIPSENGMATAGASANYSRSSLPSWIDAGKMTISPIQQNPETKELLVAPQEFTQTAIGHEAIHAYDYNTDMTKDLGNMWNSLSDKTKQELLTRSNWGSPGTEKSLDPHEALAYAAMYGYENIPDDMKAIFKKYLIPVAGPPEPNPAKRTISNFDAKAYPYFPTSTRRY